MRVTRLEWDGAEARELAARLRASAPGLEDVAEDVAATIDAVALRGDGAVLELTARFDATERAPSSLRVDPADVAAAPARIDPSLREALELAHANITAVAERSVDEAGGETVELPQGQSVRLEDRAVGAAGIYAPGGRGQYPSSVLMGVVAARVAGVGRIAVATPPAPDGHVGDLVLAACAVAGATEVYAMGGAQAIAALVLGTQTIDPVDVIAGPGNRYVTEAKRRLVGRVGIDGLAGPSELMVVLGDDASPRWAALDLCAQAEHGADGILVAVAVEESLLDELESAVGELAADRPSVTDSELSLIAAPGTEDAIALANALAPEHLQLAVADAEMLSRKVTTAGCVFLGDTGATAFGDYVAGSNHVLPTGGAGRFTGPLGPGTFRRRMSVVSLPGAAATALAEPLGVLARAEGFPVHAESAEARASR